VESFRIDERLRVQVREKRHELPLSTKGKKKKKEKGKSGTSELFFLFYLFLLDLVVTYIYSIIQYRVQSINFLNTKTKFFRDRNRDAMLSLLYIGIIHILFKLLNWSLKKFIMYNVHPTYIMTKTKTKEIIHYSMYSHHITRSNPPLPPPPPPYHHYYKVLIYLHRTEYRVQRTMHSNLAIPCSIHRAG
jgi:hypothetical protein